jgi:hypothetical protein
MAVGFYVDPVFYKVGTGDFLNSFFSTIYIVREFKLGQSISAHHEPFVSWSTGK